MHEPSPLSLDERFPKIIIQLDPLSLYTDTDWAELYGKIVEGFKVVGIDDFFSIGSGEDFIRTLTLERV